MSQALPPDGEQPPAGPAGPAGSRIAWPGTDGPGDGATPARRAGMFGVTGSGDTSGFGGLVVRPAELGTASRPYGGWFDTVADELERAFPEFGEAVERVVVDRGELTLHVRPAHLVALCRQLRDDPRLRFELCSAISGVDYPADPTGRRFHAVYHLTSLTYRRRIRLEVSVPEAAPNVPSVVPVYPTANWLEREAWDMVGIVFDGHPALTRILMPDDWPGHPQRKDYPLGGVTVEYKGAQVPPPDERRGYA